MGQKRGMVKLFGMTIEVVEGDGGGEYKMPSSDAQGRDRESTGSEERGRRRGDNDRSSSLSTAKPLKPDDNVREEARDGDDVDSKNGSLKKPDKILPCPRCNSEDTKFCYFNNYNVNQPRYFCRNCQRYWTAGGLMRNVPVGAGRRKNKSGAAAINRHISITSSSPTCLRSSLTSSSIQPVKPNQPSGVSGGSVMSFGSGRNVIDGDEKSCGSSSVTASNSAEDGIGVQGFGYPIGGTPWIYPWNNTQTPPSNLVAITPSNQTPPPSHLGFVVHSSLNPQQLQQPWLIPPKSSNTMRIEDPSEAANSSVWLGMGAERCKDNGISIGGALFKTIKPKEKGSDLLHPNPAALSRSLCFHESTWQ